MPNRFTVTEKWMDPWFRRLDPIDKLIFLHFCDICDIAGFVELDWETISYHTGIPLDEVKGAELRLVKSVDFREGHAYLTNFLKHQRNLPLELTNKAHVGIIRRIVAMLNTFPELADYLPLGYEKVCPLLGASKGLDSPTGIGNGKGEGNSMPEKLEKTPGFMAAWSEWIQHRKELKKPITPTSQKQQLKLLLASPDPVAVLETAIRNGWTGLFPIERKDSKPAQPERHRMYRSER